MKLKRVEIEGYRSIRQKICLIVEPNVTVLLGPNDHGKTNLLSALLHLNSDQQFDKDDLNWDCADQHEELPSVSAEFVLTEEERQYLWETENKAREENNRKLQQSLEAAEDSSEDEEPTDEENDEVEGSESHAESGSDDDEPDEDEADFEEEELAHLDPLQKSDVPLSLHVTRSGLKGSVEVIGLEDFLASTKKVFSSKFPRVELIDPITKLSDSVAATELAEGKNEFMRGIFYYAGINPDESEDLFVQNDRTQMAIKRASATLNKHSGKAGPKVRT